MSAPESESASGACCELPDLFGIVRSRFRLIAGMAIAFLVFALVGTWLRGERYEATAFLEVEKPEDVATVEAKLKFPSLYREVAESDDAAIDLSSRTRVKNPRGSRILALTVRHSDPETAASEANALAEAFVGHPDEEASEVVTDETAADSLPNLAKSWNMVTEEFEKLSKRYQDDADHPAVKGARERRDQVAERIRQQLGISSTSDASLGDHLELLLARADGAARPAEFGSGVRVVEAAVIPEQSAGENRMAILGGALILGAFSGLILALCGCCEPGARDR